MKAYLRENIPLAGMTTFGIGGPARWLAEPRTPDEAERCLGFAAENRVRVYVLGGGSNLLVADGGLDAMVIRLSPHGRFGAMTVDDADPLCWRVGAAVPLPALVAATARAGTAGLQGLAGIPGTVGGAVSMNAGTAGISMGEYVAEARVLDFAGGRRCLERDELEFVYRGSAVRETLATDFVLRFRERGEPETVLAGMRQCRDRKKAAQPLTLPSAGCVFRNPPGAAAGALLDAAGCKGMREGGAEVSRLHANFIVAAGGAAARDVARLARRMQDAVFERTGTLLRPEIRMWGDEPLFAALGGRDAES